MRNEAGEYIDSKLQLEWENPFICANTYHFLFVDENKKLANFTENELLFHLEIKEHNKVK